MELPLDFKAAVGRPLPPTPQSKLVGGGDVAARKSEKTKAHRHSRGSIDCAGIHTAGNNDGSLPVTGHHGGRTSYGTGWTPHIHQAIRHMAPCART